MGRSRISGVFIWYNPDPVGLSGGVFGSACSGTGNAKGGGGGVGGGVGRAEGAIIPSSRRTTDNLIYRGPFRDE